MLRHRISYLEDDLVIPSWNAALVVDTEAGMQAAVEIFEFANSQLLEFRYYDALLDSELAPSTTTCSAPAGGGSAATTSAPPTSCTRSSWTSASSPTRPRMR